jgi:general secretion pathway protein B
MSFILDALKKSENDRQRQSGPALFEVRVAPPRPRFPPWAIAVAGLLLVNVGVIGWLMLRKPAVAAPQEPVSTSSGSAASPAQTAPPPTQYYAPQSPPQGYTPPAQAGAPPQAYPPPQQYSSQPQYGPAPQAPENGLQAPPGNPTEPQLSDSRVAPESANPDDYAPATEANESSPWPGGHARRGTESGLPTYDDAAGKFGVPPLRLDLHVYAPDPRKRFIMLNMKRLGEGESLPEGVKVDSITTDGAILSYRGSQFVMDRD